MNNTTNYIKKYVSLRADNLKNVKPDFSVRMEGRTNNDDMTEALRLRVHDPLWVLSRQWQLGEFRGNDCGTAMSVSCTIKEDLCDNDPIEPVVEQINPKTDFMTSIESAVYLLDLVRNSKIYSKEEIKKFREMAIMTWPIDWNKSDCYVLEHEATREYEKKLNERLTAYIQTYQGKIFDGYELYKDIRLNSNNIKNILNNQILSDYVKWFEQKYLPASTVNQHWNNEDLCYSLSDKAGDYYFEGDRYKGGRVSWYSVDYKCTETKKISISDILDSIIEHKKNDGKTTPKSITRNVMSLPSMAHFAAAPNRRLWQMEDHKVFMGNSILKQSSGNIAMMKYVTMFSNDWMLFPLDTELGKYIQLKSINIVDTFGDKIAITGNDRAGKKDTVRDTEERWQIFTNTTVNNPKETHLDGLYYAPQLAATIEGKPIEEIRLLRDEMSNMVWGVEELVPDGCGSTIDATLYASKLTEYVDGLYETNHPKPESQEIMFSKGQNPVVKNESQKATYKYVLQSTVPFNWIPFIPQRLKKTNDAFLLGGREMILRRGKMPCYIWHEEKGDVKIDKIPVRPMGSILRQGITFQQNKHTESPLIFHEEAIQVTGIRIVKNYQRARWINGAAYNWLGIYNRLSKTNSTSGLEFDSLKKNN